MILVNFPRVMHRDEINTKLITEEAIQTFNKYE